MRRYLVAGLAGAAFGAGCSTESPVTTESPVPSFSAEVVTMFKGWFPLTPPPGGVYNACTDEFVLVSGDYNLIVRMVTSASGRTQFRVHSQVNVKGTGATSGIEYVAMEVLNLTETAGPTGAAVFHMQYPLRTISKGRAANVAGHIAIQTTVNANGEITVDRSEFVFDVCGG